MEELRAHATNLTQNIQNMSVDFRIPGKGLDDPFKRHRKKRRRGGKGNHGKMANGAPGDPDHQGPDGSGSGSGSGSESGSGSSSSYTSNESESGSDADADAASQATQTDHVADTRDPEPEQTYPDALFSQPLDYFGENLAFIDESSDTQSGKLHLDPLLDPALPEKRGRSRQPKRRRQRRPVPQGRRGSAKTSPPSSDQRPNGGPPHPPGGQVPC